MIPRLKQVEFFQHVLETLNFSTCFRNKLNFFNLFLSSYGANIGATIWGHFFRGAYLPQKSELSPPLDREGMSVQKYVTSYLTKFNPIWFK
jgi:hypothetical protein